MLKQNLKMFDRIAKIKTHIERPKDQQSSFEYRLPSIYSKLNSKYYDGKVSKSV